MLPSADVHAHLVPQRLECAAEPALLTSPYDRMHALCRLQTQRMQSGTQQPNLAGEVQRRVGQQLCNMLWRIHPQAR